MVNYLMLRLWGTLQEPRLEDIITLRHCVVAGWVNFNDLRNVASELISV